MYMHTVFGINTQHAHQLICGLTNAQLLTDYESLQKVVPNLVVNEVVQLFHGTNDPEPIPSIQSQLSDSEQCREMANRMKGAILRQVGGAKVVGINFSARTTLEVREWPGVSCDVISCTHVFRNLLVDCSSSYHFMTKYLFYLSGNAGFCPLRRRSLQRQIEIRSSQRKQE